MCNEIEYMQVIDEEFFKTKQGRIIRHARVQHNGIPTNTPPSIIYPSGYILEKWLEYKKLITKKILPYSNVKSEKDGFIRIFHYNNEIYKIENELYEIILKIETKDKIHKVFPRKRCKISDISLIKLFGQGKTCREIIEENGNGLKSDKALQNRLKPIKEKIIDKFDTFKNQDELSNEKIIKLFYNEYRKFIDEMD